MLSCHKSIKTHSKEITCPFKSNNLTAHTYVLIYISWHHHWTSKVHTVLCCFSFPPWIFWLFYRPTVQYVQVSLRRRQCVDSINFKVTVFSEKQQKKKCKDNWSWYNTHSYNRVAPQAKTCPVGKDSIFARWDNPMEGIGIHQIEKDKTSLCFPSRYLQPGASVWRTRRWRRKKVFSTFKSTLLLQKGSKLTLLCEA